jgi:hypothetical protein
MKPAIPSAILKQHTAILGKTGSGKTSTAKLMVEQVVEEGARVCVLDPIKSDWWGLTSSSSGKKAGLPFRILGGPRGHVPLHSSAGKAIGELVAKGKLRLSILDMADFEPGGIQKFFVDFAQALFKHAKGVVYLVMEEAHEFAPKERAGFSAENMAIHWAKKLSTGSRSKGIRLIVSSQRAQALHNALLGSCDTLIMHRLTLPADQAPAKDWLKANVSKEVFQKVEASMAQLETGAAWICSGEAKIFEQVKFPRIKTYDNSATPDSDTDHDVKTVVVDPEELKAIIGDAVKEAEANDPKALRAKIAQLERDMSKAVQAKVVDRPVEKIVHVADPKVTAAAEQAGYDRGWSDCSASYDARIATAQAALQQDLLDRLTSIRIVKGKFKSEFKSGLQSSAVAVKAPSGFNTPVKPDRAVRAPGSPSPAGRGNGTLPPGEKAVLVAAAQFGRVERDQLSVLTGYKRSSRDAYIARLQQKGFIVLEGREIAPTDDGVHALGGDYQPLPQGADLRKYWLDRLPEGERKVLEILIEHYPNAVDRERIDEATGYKRSSRDAYIARMKAKRIVESTGSQVVASETLF